jgi:hypothetical protein
MFKKIGLDPRVGKKARKNDYDQRNRKMHEMRIKRLVAATVIKEIKRRLRSDSSASVVGVSVVTFHPRLHQSHPCPFSNMYSSPIFFHLSLF